MIMARLSLLAALLAAFPARAADPAPTDPPYVGTWGANAAYCRIPQDRRGAPMIITTKGFDQHEAHCRFRNINQAGNTYFVVSMCSVEGDKQRNSFTLEVDGDQPTLTRVKVSQKLIRCPEPITASPPRRPPPSPLRARRPAPPLPA